MLGFENGYSSPGSIEGIAKASTTMMHARGTKRFRKPAGNFTGVKGITWQTQRDVDDPNSEAKAGDDDVQHYPGEEDDRESDAEVTDFLKAHAANYGEVNPGSWLEGFDGCDDDEVGMHLACCATHLAAAKEAHTCGDGESCHKSLNGAMHHLHHFHEALKEAINR
jgi:hypothetical protein